MAQKLDHKCIICGTMYHACDTCQKIKAFTPWRTLCDTQEHYQILLAIRSYESGLFTREESAEDIAKRGVTKGSYDNWPDSTKKKLDEIFAEPKKKRKNQAKLDESGDVSTDVSVEEQEESDEDITL